MGAAPLFRIPIADPLGFFTPFGIDQVAAHPNGEKLYIPESSALPELSALHVYRTSPGALLGSITDPNIVEPTGVCLAADSGEDKDGDDDADDDDD